MPLRNIFFLRLVEDGTKATTKKKINMDDTTIQSLYFALYGILLIASGCTFYTLYNVMQMLTSIKQIMVNQQYFNELIEHYKHDVQTLKTQFQEFTRGRNIGEAIEQQVLLAEKQLALLRRYDDLIKVNDKTDTWLQIVQSLVTGEADDD